MITAILGAALLLPLAPMASTSTDSRWDPWLGCFRLTGEELRMPMPSESESESESESDLSAPRADARVCLTPDASGRGVFIQTLADGAPFLEDNLVADGERRPVDEGNCTGWQSSTWSSDGERLYTRMELTCEQGLERRVSGVSLFVRTTWVEIQSVSVGSEEAGSVQVRRYRAVGDEEAEALSGLTPEVLAHAAARRRAIAAQLTPSDVVEAARYTDSAAVEAAVLEVRNRFALDAEALVELDEAGVSPQLIDLMVALSYPEKFVIDRERDEGSGGGGGGGGIGYRGYDYGFYDPYYGSALAYPYFYAPFGYYYWYAPYHPVYGVRPIPSTGASVGRVIAGRGYVNVSPRRPAGGRGRYARPRDGSSSGSGGESGTAGVDSGGSGGTASPSGYSRGGGSSRGAKPKPKKK